MKHLLLATVFWMINLPGFAQKVLTVSLNPKIPAQYDDIFAAINAAQAGDTLYLIPAKDIYGGTDSLLLTKPIVMIGGGFDNPTNEYTGFETRVNKLIITGKADHSLIANLYATRIHFEAKEPGDDLFENITVANCYVERFEFIARSEIFKSDSLVVRNNISPLIFFKNWTNIGNTADISLENNIVGQVANGGGINLVIRNNLFVPGLFGRSALVKLYDTNVFNNVFWGDSLRNSIGSSTCSYTIFDHNLSFRSTDFFSTVNDNSVGANNLNADPQFTSVVRVVNSLNIVRSANFTPKSSSPLVGRGTEATDIGITGGRFPFTSQSRFPFPYISSVRINNPVLGEGTLLKFTINGEYPK